MAIPPPPLPLEQLGGRPFSFYPPILNIDHNEWSFRRATWSEVLVANTKADLEVWIPRRYLGEISSTDEPVVIVGLTRELEYKAGAVWPHERQLIEIPRAVNEGFRPADAAPPAGPASVVGIRLERSTESRIGRLIGTVLAIAVIAFVLVVSVFRAGPLRSRTVFTAKDQAYLELTRRDDYFSILAKLGTPSEDRWRSDRGELQYRLLWYPDRAYSVILMGSDRKDARYIGAMDRNWRVLHYVELPGGGNTRPLLRNLGKF